MYSEGAERFRKNSNSSLKDIDTVLDTIETRKITLTPRVAQDDSSLTSSQITPTGKDVCYLALVSFLCHSY